MDCPNHATGHEAGKHFTYENYVTIEIRLKDGRTANKIAVNELHRTPNTVRNIIKKGMNLLYHGKILHFKHGRRIRRTAVIAAEAVHKICRHLCRRQEIGFDLSECRLTR